MLNIYLSGEIHTDLREEIINLCKNENLNISFSSPITNHEASDNCGVEILGQEEKNFWKRVIVEQKQTASDLSKAKALINKHQGIKKTYELASLHAEKAIDALSIFENSNIKESLIEVANTSLSRLN